MSCADAHHLRLVRSGPETHSARARREVERETRAAACNPALEPTDPRWVLAATTHAELEGATLPPERRERLMRTARRLGIRTFDASVIIAIVQDTARRGEGLQGAAETVSLLGPHAPARRGALEWVRWVAAVACGLTGTLFLIWWLTG